MARVKAWVSVQRETKPRGLEEVGLQRSCQGKVWAAEGGFWAILELGGRWFLGV